MQEPISLLLVLTAAGVVLWLTIVSAIRFVRRPRTPDAGPATMELRPEPPAVAGMVANDFAVTRDALPATLLDLAARGAVEVEHYGDDTFVELRDEHLSLTPYEARLLDHVRSLATSGRIPAEALTTGPDDASRRWWKQFRKEVMDDARRRALCRPVWDLRVTGALWAALVVLGLVFWASVRFDFETVEVTPLYVVTLVAVGVALAVGAVVVASDRQRDTALGLEAAAHWLGFREHHEANEVIPTLPASAVAVRGRYLAYSAALGLAAAAVRDLPLGAEDDRRAWTDYGGRWRQVLVRYPRLRPGWGRRPWVALLAGVVGAVFGSQVLRLGWALRGVGDTSYPELAAAAQRAGIVAIALGVLLLVWFGAEAVMAALDVGSGDRKVVGEVVRRRERPGFEFNPPKDEGGRRRYVAVDTGAVDRITAWSVDRNVYPHCQQGREVAATVTRFLHHVRRVAVP